VGGARGLCYGIVEGPGPWVPKGVWAMWVVAGASGGAGTGANTQCCRSRIDTWRSDHAWGGALVLSGGEVGQLSEDVLEVLPDGLICLEDGCEVLGPATQLMGNCDEPLDKLGEEVDGSGFCGDGVGQPFGAEVREVSGVEAKGTPGLGQLFCHKG